MDLSKSDHVYYCKLLQLSLNIMRELLSRNYCCIIQISRTTLLILLWLRKPVAISSTRCFNLPVTAMMTLV